MQSFPLLCGPLLVGCFAFFFFLLVELPCLLRLHIQCLILAFLLNTCTCTAAHQPNSCRLLPSSSTSHAAAATTTTHAKLVPLAYLVHCIAWAPLSFPPSFTHSLFSKKKKASQCVAQESSLPTHAPTTFLPSSISLPSRRYWPILFGIVVMLMPPTTRHAALPESWVGMAICSGWSVGCGSKGCRCGHQDITVLGVGVDSTKWVVEGAGHEIHMYRRNGVR
ncbi:hypothetical protein HDK90DRAFT_246984 [Phyllosticta capitalensis]|uniref:Secreted protein n=1 Tax=Phyllosticta capitalensis TaxID=121624 RepID=A0ABR1YPV0_9PEZI